MEFEEKKMKIEIKIRRGEKKCMFFLEANEDGNLIRH